MTKATIYDRYDKAFSNVSAYVLMKDDVQIGNISVKYPKDGACRLNLYFHIHGHRMVKGSASGYGYDKSTAAFEDALSKFSLADSINPNDCDKDVEMVEYIKQLLSDKSGANWADVLAHYSRKEQRNLYVLKAI